VTHRIVYDDFTSPAELVGELPGDLLEILHRAMDKDPDKRYQEASE
ncbi:MAG: hypothetical protein GWN32_08305, partial [Gemmatimonadetes bacterium]|nr:hypothetical protein [Gemmatimonadota bacterium]